MHNTDVSPVAADLQRLLKSDTLFGSFKTTTENKHRKTGKPEPGLIGALVVLVSAVLLISFLMSVVGGALWLGQHIFVDPDTLSDQSRVQSGDLAMFMATSVCSGLFVWWNAHTYPEDKGVLNQSPLAQVHSTVGEHKINLWITDAQGRELRSATYTAQDEMKAHAKLVEWEQDICELHETAKTMYLEECEQRKERAAEQEQMQKRLQERTEQVNNEVQQQLGRARS